MVLAQDQAQANQGAVLAEERKRVSDAKAAEIQYQKELVQHKKDVIKWEKKVADEAKAEEVKYQNNIIKYQTELAAWEKQKISIEAENKIIVATETKKRTDVKIAEDKRVSDFNKSETERVNKLTLADNKLVATAVSLVKADQKAKADIMFKAETKRLADLAIKEEKQRAKQEVIDKNKAFFDSGKRFNDPHSALHYATINGLPIDHKSEVKYYDGGKFTQSYYERAGVHFGITTEEAYKVSESGRMSGSGKTRDATLRRYQDPTGASETLYQSHRALAKKTTASAYGKIAADQAEADNANQANLNAVSNGLLGKAPPTDIYGSVSLMGTNVKAPQGSYVQQIETARRTQRTIDLRAGNVGLATALLEPVTANTYTNTSGRVDALTLTKTFLTERGYDLNNLDAVPDSVFKVPTKYIEARKQTSATTMGDLTKLIPKQPTMYETKKVGTAQVGVTLNEYYKKIPNAELVKRTEARERLEAIGRPVMPVNEYRQGDVQGPVQAKYEVTIGDKVRIFNSLESAEKFSARMNPEQWSVTYDVPTKIPTMTGSSVGSKIGMVGTTVVQLPVTKTFDSKEEAQTFIDNKQSNLSYTQDSKLLPMEKMYSGYDKFAKDAYQKAKDHVGMESSWMYEGGAAMASLGADMLNVVTVGGDLLDKHVLNRTVTPKQPITTIPTYYDKGTEKALEGIKITKTGVTGIPSINPLDENNIVSKWYQGASQQWGKQTTAQNIGQSAVAVPIALFDVITLGRGGVGVVNKLAPVLANTVTKVTPVISKTITKIGGTRLITKVMEAPLNVKTSAKKYPTAIDQSSPYATADNFPSKPDIDRSMTGNQLLKSLKMKGVNAAGNQSDVILVKGKKSSPVTHQDDPTYNPANRANEIDYTDNIDGFGERVKDVSGARFISPKPTLNLRVGTFETKTVKMGEQISTIERNPINVGGRNVYGFTKQTVSLPRSATTKVSKGERFNRPNYDRASSEFADFQKGLDGTPKRYTQSFTSTKVRLTDSYNLGTPVTQRLKGVGNYGAEQFRFFQERVSPSTNVVGSIKFSKGFVPGKQTRQYNPFKPKEVAEEYAYKADGKIGNLLSDTVSQSPLTVRTTQPDKIARLPKTGKAPTIGKEKYIEGIDFQPAKTPKGKNAPIGYEAPKPKPKPNTAYFSNMKSTKKNLDLTKSEPPRSRETGNSQVLLPPAPKPPKTKKKASTGPTDPLLDVTITDSPLPTEKSKNSFLILPPVIKPQTDKEKNKPKQVVIPRVIQTVTTSQIPVIKTQQKKIIKSSVINSQKITQVQPQKITQVQPQKIKAVKSQKIKAVQPQKLIQVIPQKSVQKIRQRQYLSHPLAPKRVVRQTLRPKFGFKAPQRVAQRTPTPRTNRLAFVFPVDSSEPRKERKTKKSKGKDFLGSSRTDHIVGMFNRKAIISGDKASAKQLRIDKKYKEKKRRNRNKVLKKSLMQKEGIIKKGFKI